MYPLTFGSINFTIYAYLPLIQPPCGGSYFVLGSEPVELGLEITSTSGSFGSGDVSFDGLKVAVGIDFTGGSLSKDITPEIVLLNLKLPGQETPKNQSLIDLIEHGSIDEWITMAVSVFAAQLSKAGSLSSPLDEIGAMVYDVLSLLGLTGSVPSFDWDGLYHDPKSIVQLLTNWFRSIASSPATLKTWLNDWYCLRWHLCGGQLYGWECHRDGHAPSVCYSTERDSGRAWHVFHERPRLTPPERSMFILASSSGRKQSILFSGQNLSVPRLR